MRDKYYRNGMAMTKFFLNIMGVNQIKDKYYEQPMQPQYVQKKIKVNQK